MEQMSPTKTWGSPELNDTWYMMLTSRIEKETEYKYNRINLYYWGLNFTHLKAKSNLLYCGFPKVSFLWCRYGGFSLGGSSTETLSQVHHVQDSVMAIRTRYRVPQVNMRFKTWSADAVVFLNVVKKMLMFFDHRTVHWIICWTDCQDF